MSTKYTEELLAPLVAESESVSEILRKLEVKPHAGNHSHISKIIRSYNLDTSHFCGKGWRKGKNFTPTRPIESYLSNEFPIQSDRLRQRLLNEGLFENQCGLCKNTEWLGEPINLELHHKDCNHHNNNLDNLDILCPNCHHLTHSKMREPATKPKDGRKNPRPYARKAVRPPVSQLLEEIKELGYCAVGRKYGVSDNAIRKWIK